MKSRELFMSMLGETTAHNAEKFISALKDNIEESSSAFTVVPKRIDLLKQYGTIRLAIGRHIGQTTAALEFIKNHYLTYKRVLYLGPNSTCINKYRDIIGPLDQGLSDNLTVSSWCKVGNCDPRYVSAVFVDPGPHAGPVARDAIYRFAAEAMVVPGGTGDMVPVLIYFIGS
jgi:hypothetical protein